MRGATRRGRVIPKLADALEQLNTARTAAAAGEVLHAAVADYGYDNLALSRTRRGVTLDIPWNWVPYEFAEAYFTQDWEKHDPELYYARRTLFPFAWDSIPHRVRLTSGQSHVISACSSLGLHHGMCVPLRGADGRLDLISLSASHKDHAPDPALRNAVALLSLRAMARYIELENQIETAGRDQRLAGSRCDLDDLIGGAFAPFTLPPLHLRALALVEIAARRWRMGLTTLASRVYLLRTCQPYDDLQRWGLIVDEADDLRWRYYFKPSVLGVGYLQRSPEIGEFRNEIWLGELDRREVPDGLGAT